MTNIMLSWVIVFLFGATAIASGQPQQSSSQLTFPANGYTFVEVASFARTAPRMNDSGHVIGTIQRPGHTTEAYVWYQGALTFLETPPGWSAYPVAINNGGVIVGNLPAPAGNTHAFLWRNGSLVDFGTFGGSNSYAVAITNSGHVLLYGDTGDGERTFVWRNGVMTDIGTLNGGTGSTVGLAVNERGQVVGDATTASGEFHAFLWEKGVMLDLGTLEGSTHSTAWGINERGQVIGSSFFLDSLGFGRDYRAFVWEQGVMTELPGLGLETDPVAINEHGQIVGSTRPENGG